MVCAQQGMVDLHARADYEEGGFNLVAGDISMNNNNGEEGNGPIIVFPGNHQGPSEQEPARDFCIHEPQYHWHVEGGNDTMAHQAIEILDHQTF